MLLIYANRHCSLETVFRMLTFQSIFAIYLFGDGFAGDWGNMLFSILHSFVLEMSRYSVSWTQQAKVE